LSKLRRNTRKNEAENSVAETIDCVTDWQAAACSRTLIVERVIVVSTEQEIQRCGNRIACTSQRGWLWLLDAIAIRGARGFFLHHAASSTTLRHFAVCSMTSLSRSAGEAINTVLAKSATRAVIWGSASAALISLLSLSMITTSGLRLKIRRGVAYPNGRRDDLRQRSCGWSRLKNDPGPARVDAGRAAR
jgi:hypothetical protein